MGNVHWLRVPERLGYRLCLLVLKAVHEYLGELCWSNLEDTARSRLRSAAHLRVPRSKTLVIVHLQSPGQRYEETDYWLPATIQPIWHSSEFQEQSESSLLLMDHFFFLFIHLERGRPWIGLHVTAPKKITFIIIIICAGTSFPVLKLAVAEMYARNGYGGYLETERVGKAQHWNAELTLLLLLLHISSQWSMRISPLQKTIIWPIFSRRMQNRLTAITPFKVNNFRTSWKACMNLLTFHLHRFRDIEDY